VHREVSMSHPAVENGTADVNGARLHYEIRGAGRPLVFLHGFTLDHRMWRSQAERLASSYRVLTYDARGFGRSALPDTTPYKHCEDAAALCEHLELRRVVAIGHSIGAHQMLELSLTRPDLVAGWASICMSGLASVPFPEDVMTMFGALRAAARDEGIEAAKRLWMRADWFAPARESPDVTRELDAMLADYSGWHWTHDNPAKTIEPAAAERLGELKAPSLVIAGGRDLPYNEAVAQALLAGLPNATALQLPRAGHMANMEEPEPIHQAIDALAKRATF
jgi:3-oxoadipate enol-lactonase